VRKPTVAPPTSCCATTSAASRGSTGEAAFHEYSLRRAGVRVIYRHDPGANDAGVAGHLVKSLKRVLAHEYSQKLSRETAGDPSLVSPAA